MAARILDKLSTSLIEEFFGWVLQRSTLRFCLTLVVFCYIICASERGYATAKKKGPSRFFPAHSSAPTEGIIMNGQTDWKGVLKQGQPVFLI